MKCAGPAVAAAARRASAILSVVSGGFALTGTLSGGKSGTDHVFQRDPEPPELFSRGSSNDRKKRGPSLICKRYSSCGHRLEIEHYAADNAAGLEILERAVCLVGGPRLDRRRLDLALL